MFWILQVNSLITRVLRRGKLGVRVRDEDVTTEA